MLFKQDILNGLQKGTITLAFRRWQRPTVKAGTQLRTPVGVLVIDTVEVVSVNKIAEKEARLAGFSTLTELRGDLAANNAGKVYRIKLHYVGADPRVKLRQRAHLTNAEFTEIQVKLSRLDAASRNGPWTIAVLELIKKHDGVRAAELASAIASDVAIFKRRVRQLKELGLTESLGVGYRLSPRGRAYFNRRI